MSRRTEEDNQPHVYGRTAREHLAAARLAVERYARSNPPLPRPRLRSPFEALLTEDVPSTSRAVFKPPSAAALKTARKEEAERKLQQIFTELNALINDPNVSGPKMDTFLSTYLTTTNRKKMLDIELWKPVLQKWMTTKMWAPFYYIVNKRYTEDDSSSWFSFIIRFMAEHGIYEMFHKTHNKEHPFWSQMKKDVADEDSEWWNESLIQISSKQPMSNNEIEFFKKLYEDDWFVPLNVYFTIPSDLHPYAALRFLKKNKEYALLDSDEFYQLTYRLDKPIVFHLVTHIVEAYAANKNNPPIVFVRNHHVPNDYTLIDTSRFFKFVEYCVKSQSKELQNAFIKLVDMKKPENKKAFELYLFDYIMARYTAFVQRMNEERTHAATLDRFNIINFILKNYKNDMNDLYVNIDMDDVIPRSGLHRNVNVILYRMLPVLSKFPILTLAVLFKCNELIRLLITYTNASPKRCVFNIFDLTTDMDTINALNIKRTLKHVSHRYKEEIEKPENPIGQAIRRKKWEAHLKSGGSKRVK